MQECMVLKSADPTAKAGIAIFVHKISSNAVIEDTAITDKLITAC